MKKIAVIPVYEPMKVLKDIVLELKENKFIVVVVNDGSGKEYNQIFDMIKDSAKVLEYADNMGKGYALKYGFNYVKEHYSDYVLVTVDGDNQHKVSDAKKLCDYVEEHMDTLVLGKRIRGGKTPLRSRIGNAITMMVYHMVTGNKIYDTQTGLRAFSYKLMPFCLNVTGNRYEYEMRVLLEAKRNNISVEEIEIATIYHNNNANSHFKTVKDAFLIYKEIFKFIIKK